MEIVLGCLGAIVLAVGVGAFETWVFMELGCGFAVLCARTVFLGSVGRLGVA